MRAILLPGTLVLHATHNTYEGWKGVGSAAPWEYSLFKSMVTMLHTTQNLKPFCMCSGSVLFDRGPWVCPGPEERGGGGAGGDINSSSHAHSILPTYKSALWCCILQDQYWILDLSTIVLSSCGSLHMSRGISA